MQYLVDTNVFLHDINSYIYGVADLCKNKNTDICITPTILSELDPGYYREKQDKSTKEVYTCVYNFTAGTYGIKVIKLIKLSDVEGAKEEMKKIRERFYGWMRNPAYLRKLIDCEILTKEEIKKNSFKNKDLGECELVAIAKASKGEFWLVTDDKGQVYKHPDQNIFDTYINDPDVNILSGVEWIEKIGYVEESTG